jgi:hypothetical protein
MGAQAQAGDATANPTDIVTYERRRATWSTIHDGLPNSSSKQLLPSRKEGRDMASHLALIERTNHRDLNRVEVHVTVTELSAGRQSWSGEFMSRSADGILPNERLAFTLDNGQKGAARVSETRFDSRTPEATMVHFTGTGPLV